MKQTIEQKKATFVTLMNENGFKPTGETVYSGGAIYAREWKKTGYVCWQGETEITYRIEAFENCGRACFTFFENGREMETRNYTSPKRGINAVREIVTFARYEF